MKNPPFEKGIGSERVKNALKNIPSMSKKVTF